MNSKALSSPTPQQLKTFTDLVKDIRIAMLTTVQPDGSLRSRPMATSDCEFDGDLWFFTEDDSAKVDEITDEHHVGLAYASPDHQRYVSVSGLASLVRDKARIKELWNPAVKAWFPRGVDDPHLALLRVRANTVEYWDSPSGKMVQLFGLAKAIVTGHRPENLGAHQKIQISPPPAETME